MKRVFLLILMILLLIPLNCFSENNDFWVSDFPNDDGRKLILNFNPAFLNYQNLNIYRSFDDLNYDLVFANPESSSLIDEFEVYTKNEVIYRLSFTNNEGLQDEIFASGFPRAHWFNSNKISILLLLVIFCLAVVYYIFRAGRGDEFFIRRINGLDALEEAVGRATEMGKPVLFVPGIMDLDDMQTIAGLTILGKLAEKAAEYHTKLLVPVSKSMVLTAAREIVKAAYLKAGCPDEYQQDNIFYLTDDQFGYVAGVDGIIVREKPAANFLLGSFYAESLIIAETGFASGAIQIAGTAMPSQLPFFVAACDYTLIGEELFAASAYLSKNSQQLGSLKGQDFGKIIVIIIILAGVILEIFGISGFKNFLNIS